MKVFRVVIIKEGKKAYGNWLDLNKHTLKEVTETANELKKDGYKWYFEYGNRP